MKLLPLDDLRAQVKARAPLPFSIRDAQGHLLLAKGHVVPDDVALEALLSRGATVDAEETGRRGEALAPPAENFPGRWHQLCARAAGALRPPFGAEGLERTRDLAAQIVDMAQRDADLLLYLALRSARDPGVHFGALHAVHAAVACAVVAGRLGWEPGRRDALLCAALTMNLSIAELQSRLAGSIQPLTPAQRERVDQHVQDSLRLLADAGLEESLWLRIVGQHHAPSAGQPDEVGEEARLLRLVDGYTLRIAERPDTIVASPALAARDLFTHHAKDPLALALLKAMGLYPPGCHVRLASGEVAVVLRLGAAANAPLVACLTNRRGDALQTPIRRDTSLLPEHHIAAVVADRDVKVRFTSQVLYR